MDLFAHHTDTLGEKTKHAAIVPVSRGNKETLTSVADEAQYQYKNNRLAFLKGRSKQIVEVGELLISRYST